MPSGGGRRDERGVVLPTGLMVGSILAVALAAVAFVLTAHPAQKETATTVARGQRAGLLRLVVACRLGGHLADSSGSRVLFVSHRKA